MSFQKPSNVQRPVFGQPQQQDERWKAQAFINLRLPTRNGGKRKLAGIPLRASNPGELDIINYLSSGTEEEVQDKIIALFSKLEVDFQLVDNSEDASFDLS